MTAPVTGITPAYGIEYLVEGEPVKWTRQKLERNAKQIEAALLAGGVAPPGASDYAALVGRVTVLEAKTVTAAVTLTAPWTAYVDATAGWNGLRRSSLGALFTIAGAIQIPTGSSAAAGATIATLPVGQRPGIQLHGVASSGAGYVLKTDGRIIKQTAAAAGFVESLSFTYVAQA